MTDALLTPPLPVPDAVTAGFWEATARGTLAIARCTECRRWDHPPQERCRHCGGPITFEEVSGRGTLFSFIVVRRQFVPGHPPPEVIGLVELEEQPGLRVVALVDVDPAEATVGAAVQARIRPVGDGPLAAPVFTR